MEHKNLLVNSLNRIKQQHSIHENSLDGFTSILKSLDEKRNTILTNLLTENNAESCSSVPFEALNTSNIYHLKHIERLCTDHRLRFLDSHLFKGEIPAEAISKIRKIESDFNVILSGYKIIAPAKLFKLKKKDDPLLFVPLGNDYFYLIHQWGKDLHPLRKLMVWPAKNALNLVFSVFMLSLIVAVVALNTVTAKASPVALFLVTLLFTFKSIIALVVFFGIAKGKRFNSLAWNSNYV